MTSCQWWDQFKIFIYIFLLVVNFFFKTVAFEFNNHSFCTGTGLIRSGSVQFVYIGFQVFSAYFRVFQFVNDVFFQALHIFIFFFFINVEKVKKKKYQNLGIPEIVYYNLEEHYSFLDYIFGGI